MKMKWLLPLYAGSVAGFSAGLAFLYCYWSACEVTFSDSVVSVVCIVLGVIGMLVLTRKIKEKVNDD